MAKVLIGISGSIAAVKIIRLVHLLTQANHSCKVILTTNGATFVTPLSLASMGADVYTNKQPSYNHTQVMEHINLGKWADYILIAPASSNTIAKLAHGFADNLLTATVLASNAPKIIIPAMNQQMWHNPLTQANLEKLKNYQHIIWQPKFGLQACGDIGSGRMLEAEEIFEALTALITAKNNLSLQGQQIVITAGATQEPIDPVRYLSNYSSGKMGFALAQAAINMGAQVTLISGITQLEPPLGLNNLVQVTTTQDMLHQVLHFAPTAQIFIGCAAVCDYCITNYQAQKIKSKNNKLSLQLSLNPDIIAQVKTNFPHLFVVGFAAETENLINHALDKLKRKNMDMIIANDVSNNQVLGKDLSQATVITKQLQQFSTKLITKLDLAYLILQKISENRSLSTAHNHKNNFIKN